MVVEISEQDILGRPNDYELGSYVRQKLWDEKKLRLSNRDEHVMLKIDENGRVVALGNDDVEVCVVCGKETDVPVSMHVDYRVGYIEGVGQLCTFCNNL